MRIREMMIVAAALTLAISAEWLVTGNGAHGDVWWSHVPGFVAFFGLVICVVLIYVGKALAKWLSRDERYYDQCD
jgi:hypothetical protein